jgi:Lrp/AsnC family transcriptional regulator, regulator for asnA, asnC and gidA
MDNIDALDEQIIKLLEQNPRQSSRTLAKQLGVSPITIRRRTNTLLEKKVIDIKTVSNPMRLGYTIVVVIALDVNQEDVDTVAQVLSEKENVEWISIVTGRFDIIALARFKSMEEFYSFNKNNLSEIAGIKDSETFVCTKVKKAIGLF